MTPLSVIGFPGRVSLLEVDIVSDLLDQHAAARLLRSSRTTLFRLRRSGQLEAVNHGGRLMYRRADLERLRLEGWDVPSRGWLAELHGNLQYENPRIPPGCK